LLKRKGEEIRGKTFLELGLGKTLSYKRVFFQVKTNGIPKKKGRNPNGYLNLPGLGTKLVFESGKLERETLEVGLKKGFPWKNLNGRFGMEVC